MKKLLWPLLALCFLTACASGQTPENSAALAPTTSTAPPEASETLTPPKSVVPLEPPEAITLLDADCSGNVPLQDDGKMPCANRLCALRRAGEHAVIRAFCYALGQRRTHHHTAAGISGQARQTVIQTLGTESAALEEQQTPAVMSAQELAAEVMYRYYLGRKLKEVQDFSDITQKQYNLCGLWRGGMKTYKIFSSSP